MQYESILSFSGAGTAPLQCYRGPGQMGQLDWPLSCPRLLVRGSDKQTHLANGLRLHWGGGRNTLKKPITFRRSFSGGAVQDCSLTIWLATEVAQECSLPQNWWLLYGWPFPEQLGGGVCAPSRLLLLAALHFQPLPDHSGASCMIMARD